MNAQLVHQLAIKGNLPLAKRHLDSISELELSFVRANTDWSLIEPLPPVEGERSYDFTAHDRWVRALSERGLRWQLTAVGIATPPWSRASGADAACAERATPDSAAFASMLRALVGRYGADGSFWEEHPELEKLPPIAYEVWNEPNYEPFWCPSPDPASYARVLRAGAEAAKAEDPSARIALGGLAGFASTGPTPGGFAIEPSEFVRAVLEAEPQVTELVELAALHPYAADPEIVMQRLAIFRGTLSALGWNAEISVNEVGWPTRGVGGLAPRDDPTRGSLLARLATALAGGQCGVSSFAPHAWFTPESDPGDPESWFGIADPRTAAPYGSAIDYAGAARAAIQGNFSEADTFAGCERR